MKQWILDTGNHRFATDKININRVLSIGKTAMKGKNAIIGAEKGNVVILLNETHDSVEGLNKSIAEYEGNGFKVYHT